MRVSLRYSPMKIGILASNFRFPPREGAEAQLLLTLENLRAVGHDIEFLGILTNGEKNIPQDFPFGGGGGVAGSPKYPIQIFYAIILICSRLKLLIFFPKLKFIYKNLCSWISTKDKIYIQGMPLVWLPWAIKSHKIVWSPVDSYSLRYKRLTEYYRNRSRLRFIYSRFALKTAALLERIGVKNASKVHVVGYEDARHLELLHGARNVIAIPIFRQGRRVLAKPEIGGKRILVWADYRIDYLRESALECLNSLIPLKGGWEITLLGKGSADLLRSSDNFKFVIGKEWVRDIDEELMSASLIVIPDILGSGIKNRTVHAMGLGCCVAGLESAFQSIPIKSGKDCYILERWSQLAYLMQNIAAQPNIVQDIGFQASQTISSHFCTQELVHRWQTLLS